MSVRYIFDAICPLGRYGDLYHIATEQRDGNIAFEHWRKYIAFAKANISPITKKENWTRSFIVPRPI